MLIQLNIFNFALIEKLSVSFDKGFNIFSGETGAGKSIMIDAINYVLGGKFSKDFIRTGAESTYVEAIFELENNATKEILNVMEFPIEDLLIISRETYQSGRSLLKINGRAALISQMKAIGETLIDIHGQHDNQKLLKGANHIYYLDNFGDTVYKNLLKQYKIIYDDYNEILSQISEIQGKDKDRDKIVDYLKYQIEEIDNSRLKIGEDDELESQYGILSNSERISKVLGESYNVLYDAEEGNLPVLDGLNLVIKELRTIEKHMDKAKTIASSLEECYFNIEENANEIRNLNETIVFDEEMLQSINSRLYSIELLKKKYGATIKDILEYREKLQKEYDEFQNSEKKLKMLHESKDKIWESLILVSKELHKKREKSAVELENKIKKELAYIGMEKSVLKVEICNEEKPNQNGMDKVQFLISTNPGEPLKPLERIVSGGELSRIMLSLKTVFINKDNIPTVIFDEIDTGISGSIAQRVGEKMFQVSTAHQVFCVTHLPQIASISDNHYVVSKRINSGKTYTDIIKLDYNNKLKEIARMIGGSEITEISLKHSEEMIKISQNQKEKFKIS